MLFDYNGRSLMRMLLESLAAVCRERPIEPKVLFVSSFTVGHQITDSLARLHVPWFNLRIETIDSLAMDIAGDELARRGLTLTSRAQSLALVEQACGDALDSRSYFGAMRNQPGLHRAIRRTLDDLRRAGVQPDTLPAGPFEDLRKRDDLGRILRRYEELLDTMSLIDRAGTLRLALDLLRPAPAPSTDPLSHTPAAADTIWIVPESLDLTSDELELLDGVTRGVLRRIDASVAPARDTADLFFAASPVEMFAAIGEGNEVRETLRRIMDLPLPIDSVEILYTRTDDYLPLLVELLAERELPATFHEGVPVSFSRPGRAALDWLEWLAADCDANILRESLDALVLDLERATGDETAPGGVAAARIVRRASIGWGRDRYLPRLRAIAEEYQRNHIEAVNEGEEAKATHFQEKRKQTETVTDAIQKLLDLTPIPDHGRLRLGDASAGVATFIEHFARIGTARDGRAAAAISGLMREMSILGDLHADVSAITGRLRDAILELHVDAETPRAGHLHVSPLRGGGWSGRTHNFVMGLDENRWPGSAPQDPVLLDFERSRINDILPDHTLPLIAERPERAARNARAHLASLEGTLTLSYSSFDLLGGREQSPSSFLLEAGRSTGDRHDLDYSGLVAELTPARAFLPSSRPSIESEWWLQTLLRENATDHSINASLYEAFPSLEQGARAMSARASDRLTPWDGILAGAPETLDPRITGRPMSSSRLERLASCPFGAFLEQHLGITPVHDLIRDPEHWLDAREFGTLFHQILRDFMDAVTARGETPSMRHAKLLDEIATGQLDAMVATIPPPNDAAFALRTNEVLEACSIFLEEEERSAVQATPRYFETPFGLPDEPGAIPSAIATSDPVAIDLGSGSILHVRGRIDRIDERNDGTWEVWDYKTGKATQYDTHGYLSRGTRLQHALYAMATETMLERAGTPGRVSRSGYYFPTRRGQGHRVPLAPDTSRVRPALQNLLDLVQNGTFIHATDPDACRYCDFATICGSAKEAAAAAQRKINANQDHPGIDAWLRLQECQ